MPTDGPTFRIDPIEPSQVPVRFRALLDRLEPALGEADVTELRRLVDGGELATAYARLDAITNDGTVRVDTATLVEIVLLGQAIRTA
jgi:hypothetical protein